MDESLGLEFGQKILEGLQWYAITVVIGFFLGLAIWRSNRQRVGSFVIVVNVFFFTFALTVLGVGYLLVEVWHLEQTIGFWGVFLIAMIAGLLAMLIPYYPLKILFAPYEYLGADISRMDTRLLSPLDMRRQEYMARKHRRRP